MKRWMLTGILGIGLVTSSILFTPHSAGAWWTEELLQQVVYLEGDPDSPGINAPGDAPVSDEEGFLEDSSILTTALVILVDLIL